VFTGLISGMRFSELENGWLNLVGEAWQQSYVTRDGGQSWQVYGGRRGLNDPSPTSAYFFDRDQGWAITSRKIDSHSLNLYAFRIRKHGQRAVGQLSLSRRLIDLREPIFQSLLHFTGRQRAAITSTWGHTGDG
jgi:hypothetical protein